MNRTKLIYGAAILIVVALVLWYVIHILTTPKPPSTTQTGTSFPISTSTQPDSGTPNILSIPVQHGQLMTVKNFLQNGVTIPDPSNAGRYLLAGDLGYCPPDQSCVAGDTKGEFNIFYDQTSSVFTIGLLKEPLGQARLDAEKSLENSLGISANALCALKYYIGTTYTVNESYSSDSLGFSSCPGATQLPY